MSIFGGEWRCHVCGDMRPDDCISVYSESREIEGTEVVETANVRYCNDRPGCAAGATLKARSWLRVRTGQ